MNPTYTLVIDVTLAMHKEIRDIRVQLKRYIDFVPTEGMKFTFTNEAEESLELSLINLHYDYSAKAFIEEQQDDTLLEEIRAGGPELSVTTVRAAEYVSFYESFGFEKTL